MAFTLCKQRTDSAFYKQLCRFCLSHGTGSIHKYNNELGSSIWSFLKSCSFDQIDVSDNYPEKICHKCTAVIISFDHFLKQSLKSQLVFQEWQSQLAEPKDATPVKDEHNYAGAAVEVQHVGDCSRVNYSNEDDSSKLPVVLECSYCLKTFKRKSYLRNHIKCRHLYDENGGYIICSICGKLFKGRANLSTHVKSVHNKTLKKCSECNATITASGLTRHMLKHCPESHPKFLCNLCGRVLKSLKSLERHENIHKNIMDFPCNNCEASFAMKSSLINHQRQHNGLSPKTFPCELCDKVFRGKHTLKRHQLWHSGVKPFSCGSCEKSFFAKNELKVHEKQHGVQLRKSCVYCDKVFENVSRLRLHIMAHKNVRPHACHICGKAFILRKRLSKHLFARHKIAPNASDLVWKDPKTYLSLNQLLEL